MLCMAHDYDFQIPQFESTDRREMLQRMRPQLDAHYARYAEKHHVPGMVYGVLLDGELVHTLGLGARVVGRAAPVDEDTVFRIASMTKSFAALAILMLRDAGKLRLDDPAADYAAELAQLDYPTRDSIPITVRQLLTMAAGWPEDDPWGDRQLAWRDDELAAHLAHAVAFSRAPGVAFEYSNLGYMALGRIIHTVSGMPAPEFITQHILRPLGMTSTVWNRAEVDEERLALGYRWEGDAWSPEPILPTGGDVGAFAGIFTTLRDLTKWVNLFLSAFPPRNEADDGIVRRSSLREMQQAWRTRDVLHEQDSLAAPATSATRSYGYGLFVQQTPDLTLIGHSGGLPGYGTAMRWAPEHGLGLIALSNRTYAPMAQATLEAITFAIAPGKLPPRRIAPSAALLAAQAGVNQLLDTWDDALADRLVAMNFFLDRSRASWQARFERLRQEHGALESETALQPENALRGSWTMRGERGTVKITLALSPTAPPLIQRLEIESVLPPSPRQVKAAAQVLAAVARPSRRRLARLLAETADESAIWDQVRLANILCGACTPGKVVACNGATYAEWKLAGSRRPIRLVLTLDAAGAKITNLLFKPV